TSKVLRHSIEFMRLRRENAAQEVKRLREEYDGRNKDTKPSFDIDTILGDYSNDVLGLMKMQKSTIPGVSFQIDLQIPNQPAIPFLHFENNKFVTLVEVGRISVEFKVDSLVKGLVLRAAGLTDDVPNGLYFNKIN
ncbi:hypothetical protein HDV02_003670, partial [Globomyces sp. JEL0801]